MDNKKKEILRSIIENYQKEELVSKQQIKKFMKPIVAAYVDEIRSKMKLMHYQDMVQRSKFGLL